MRITKNKKIDKRTKVIRYIRENKQLLKAAITLGILFGLIVTPIIYKWLNPPMLDPRGTSFIPRVVEVKALEKDWNLDLVGYFRHRGDEIGYDEYEITKLHGVMDCENGLHTANRKNYLYDGEKGRYTAAGFAMITNSTWRQHKCEGSKWNGVDNINCFYKIIGKNKLRDYNASKSCWIKKFNPNTITFIEIQ